MSSEEAATLAANNGGINFQSLLIAGMARIIAYDVDTGDHGVLAEFDPALFRKGGPGFITEDEESSGL